MLYFQNYKELQAFMQKFHNKQGFILRQFQYQPSLNETVDVRKSGKSIEKFEYLLIKISYLAVFA